GSARASELGEAGAGWGGRAVRAGSVEQMADPACVAPTEEIEGVLERDPRALRDLELAVELEELEIGLRHVAHQGEQHASPGGLGGQVLGAGGLRGAPDPAPDVELPRAAGGGERRIEGRARRDRPTGGVSLARR